MGNAVINALVIVGVITLATFVLVFCYYMRWLKLMVGYLMLSSTMLLGYSGGFVVWTFFQVFHVSISWVTFGLIMWNFAIVGVISVSAAPVCALFPALTAPAPQIFYQKGIPRWVTQGYLICVSVIMSWIVTKLPEWSSWALLVALALYDLCAVLTPCGPLRALISLAETRQDPIPGLLYEANVGSSDNDAVRDTLVPRVSRNTAASTRGGSGQDAAQPLTARSSSSSAPAAAASNPIHDGARVNVGASPVVAAAVIPSPTSASTGNSTGAAGHDDTGRAALVDRSAGQRTSSSAAPAQGGGDSSEEDDVYVEAPSVPPPAVPKEGNTLPLAADVDVAEYQVEATEGQEEIEEMNAAERSVKLGLGDFVFYSVLVGRAALFDFTTVATSYIAILAGLGGTLFLLGVLRKALPALPISIFLGVVFYFVTRIAVVPFVAEMALNGIVV